MRVQFNADVVWYELPFKQGDVVDLDNDIARRLIRAGTVVPVPAAAVEEPKEKAKEEESNGDKDITASEDGGLGESLDNGAGKDAPQRRTVRRNK